MSQNSYNIDQTIAFSGLKADSGFDRVESFIAEGAIPFGTGLVKGETNEEVTLPIKNQATLSIDADLVTSNSTIVTVNGNPTTATVFATDHDTTMGVIAGKISALTGVDTAVYPGTGRDIVITGENGIVIDASAVTTAGASQGVWTQVQISSKVFRGIAVHQHVPQTLNTDTPPSVAQYLNQETVGVMQQGVIWMRIETSNVGTLAVDDAVAADVAIGGVEAGRVTSVLTNNKLIPTGVCRQLTVDPDGIAIAKIQINIP